MSRTFANRQPRGLLCGLLLLASFQRLLAEGGDAAAPVPHDSEALPSLEQAIASKQDLWTDAALRQPNGPSFEFFEPLLPPLHYVNTDFRHYPLVLSAPNALRKARLVSNGSALNARARTRVWNEPGTPVLFRVGKDELAFGEYLQNLEGPKLLEGYLPIVELKYNHGGGAYSQETFAGVEPQWASNAVIFTRFGYRAEETEEGRLTILLDSLESVTAERGRLVNAAGEALLWFDANWQWDSARRLLSTTITNGVWPALAVATLPAPGSVASPLDGGGFEARRQRCLDTWSAVLRGGMNVEVPEPRVNDAWRTLILADFSLIHGDSIHYSAGNQYDKLYEQEGSSAALALLTYGYEADARRLLVPLLEFTRKGLEFHQAGHKLDDVCRYYWQTRDAEFVRSLRPKWQKEVDLLAAHRSKENGLFPREQYCGDIPTPVFSMNSNAKGWRALRDTAALFDALGEKSEAARLRQIAADFRKDILAALDKSLRPGLDPPFVPNALLGEEEPYNLITGSRMGSYWNLMANNILGTEIFGPGSELETGMLHYFQEHGGLFMGLVRARPWPSFWVGTANLNPLYGWYYVRTLLRRDEPERALASFYGMLAAGFTPDTFTAGEACALQSVDRWGRQYYCPPNSAGNAFWLLMLRHLLVQDWDLDQDGEPETLRLLFATPKRWLADGKVIKLERAPTAFGPVSLRVESRLSQGRVLVEVNLPKRNRPKQTLLRIRVPDGWRVKSAKTSSGELKVDDKGTADISRLEGKATLEFQVQRDMEHSTTDGHG